MSLVNDSTASAVGAGLPPTILVIDSDRLTQDLIVNWLASAGFSVLPAQNDADGPTLCHNQPCDLALIDMAGPKAHGPRALAAIVNALPELPVIAIVGQGNQGDTVKALRLGAWDYLGKPLDRTLLIHQIDKVMERAELFRKNARHRQDLEAEVSRRTAQLNLRTQELEESNLRLQKEVEARRQIEGRLNEAMAEWQTTFDSMPDFISIHDADYTIVKANKALTQFLGKTAAEIIGKKCYQVFHGNCEPWATCPHRELLATGQSYTSEVIDPHLGIPLSITVSPLRSNGLLIGSIHVAKDISRQKKLEEERQKSINLEALAVLCGGLAHDFSNLLAALGGYLDLAGMEKRPEVLPNWINNAKMVTNLAAELTKQLRAFSKGGDPICSHVSVPMLIEDSLAHIQHSFHQVRPEIHIAKDTWPLNADHGQLQTVIRNIFYNAAEAMPNGGTLTIEAYNIAKQGDDRHDYPPGQAVVQSPLEVDSVLLRFIDQGVGISPEILGKIFDPYFTTSAKGATKGKGLGLALCHSIISRHHGKIMVSSAPGQGTTVSIYLPAGQAS